MAATSGNESRGLIFTQYRKKVDGGIDDFDYATYNLTLRLEPGETDDVMLQRLQWWDRALTNLGWTQGNEPKRPNFTPRGGGSGGNRQRQEPTPVTEDSPGSNTGSFEVGAVSLFPYNNANHVKAFGVGGEEVVAWDGKALDASLKVMPPAAAGEFLNWAGWTKDDQHRINWQSHRLIAHCKKSAIKVENGKQKGGKWYVESFEVVAK